MKICAVLGTRPEIIKMFPVIKVCKERGIECLLVHTGQHYSYGMDKIFFEELDLDDPDYTLEVGSGPHGKQTARIVERCEKVFFERKPDIVLVEGDTNTVFGAALSASKLLIRIGHIEAGLRSFDREMPEEVNRVLTDHISDFCFAPTIGARLNLTNEGIDNSKIFVTGNTIVDSLLHFKSIAEEKSRVLEDLSIKKRDYVLVTAHRQENVDDKRKLSNILMGLVNIKRELGIPVIYPVHPRTAKMMDRLRIERPAEITFIYPRGYLDFIKLQCNAKLVLTDSGGVQEESCILGIPCITLRENTERPETIEVGANTLAGTDPDRIIESVRSIVHMRSWNNPFGNGTASNRIVDILTK